MPESRLAIDVYIEIQDGGRANCYISFSVPGCNCSAAHQSFRSSSQFPPKHKSFLRPKVASDNISRLSGILLNKNESSESKYKYSVLYLSIHIRSIFIIILYTYAI